MATSQAVGVLMDWLIEEERQNWKWGIYDVQALRSLNRVSDIVNSGVQEIFNKGKNSLQDLIDLQTRSFNDYMEAVDIIQGGYTHPDSVRNQSGETFLTLAVSEVPGSWIIEELIRLGGDVRSLPILKTQH
jgi:hypothetical protein